MKSQGPFCNRFYETIQTLLFTHYATPPPNVCSSGMFGQSRCDPPLHSRVRLNGFRGPVGQGPSVGQVPRQCCSLSSCYSCQIAAKKHTQITWWHVTLLQSRAADQIRASEAVGEDTSKWELQTEKERETERGREQEKDTQRERQSVYVSKRGGWISNLLHNSRWWYLRVPYSVSLVNRGGWIKKRTPVSEKGFSVQRASQMARRHSSVGKRSDARRDSTSSTQGCIVRSPLCLLFPACSTPSLSHNVFR